MTTPESRVPLFIDAYANHDSRALRALVYGVTNGQEGVFDTDHLRVSALTTPGAQITVAPGVFAALNRAVGGRFETYLDKLDTEIVKDVTATGPTVGGRTDLVVARVKNPYPGGAGTGPGGGNWPEPADRANGPYWDVDVLEGVSPNINSPQAIQATMCAIPLARIVRPVNTGIVQAAHLLELRSLVDLTQQRITIIENPPYDPPPIAQALQTANVLCNSGDQLLASATSFINWPAQATFTAPVPSWARTCDVLVFINPNLTNGNNNGELRMLIDGTAVSLAPTPWNLDHDGGTSIQQHIVMIAGTFTVPTGKPGKIVTVTTQARSTQNDSSHTGRLRTHGGCTASFQLNWKRGVS